MNPISEQGRRLQLHAETPCTTCGADNWFTDGDRATAIPMLNSTEEVLDALEESRPIVLDDPQGPQSYIPVFTLICTGCGLLKTFSPSIGT